MSDSTYHLIISNKTDLTVVKLSEGQFVDSQHFEIEAFTKDDYDHKTLLSNNGQIYRINKLGKKEEEEEDEAKQEVVEIKTQLSGESQLNIITLH